MKLFQFSNESNFNIIKTEDAKEIFELRSLGYSDSIEEAKDRELGRINSRINNEKQNHTNLINDLLLKIDLIKNF
jgi:hypothetical protein